MENINQYAIEIARRTDEALSRGKTDEALRVSGEALAALDSEWTLRHNSQRNDAAEVLYAGNFVGCRHIEALAAAGLHRDACATSLMLLLRQSIAISEPIGNDRMALQSTTDLLFRALTSLLEISESFAGNSDATSHYATIVSYIASMLYAAYKEAANRCPDFPPLEEIYSLLKEMNEIGAIQHPTIHVVDTYIEASDITAILPDLLGRARALHLLDDEE